MSVVKNARNIPAINEQKILNKVPDKKGRLYRNGTWRKAMEIKLYHLFSCRCLATCERWLSRNLVGTKAKAKECEMWKGKFADRQLLWKASGEHEAIQKQSKMTKRRVKRRKQISAKCRTLFVKDLIFMMLSPNQNASFWSGGWIEKPKEKLVENHTCLEAISNQSEVCKMFLNLIFIKKDQRMGSKSCNKL